MHPLSIIEGRKWAEQDGMSSVHARASESTGWARRAEWRVTRGLGGLMKLLRSVIAGEYLGSILMYVLVFYRSMSFWWTLWSSL